MKSGAERHRSLQGSWDASRSFGFKTNIGVIMKSEHYKSVLIVVCVIGLLSLGVQENCASAAFSGFVNVDPIGTYLFTDPWDSAGAPTSIDLVSFGFQAGDYLSLKREGAYKPGSGFPDNRFDLVAVFVGNTGFLAPGPQSQTSPVVTTPTWYTHTPTDIPQDFSISDQFVLVQVPQGATSLLFSPNDSFFSDNDDPNGDYGVLVSPVASITVALNPDAGSVTGPGINCGNGNTDCQEVYQPGQSVDFSATPKTGWTFAYWLDGTTQLDKNPLTLMIRKQKNLKAVFCQAANAVDVSKYTGTVAPAAWRKLYTAGIRHVIAGAWGGRSPYFVANSQLKGARDKHMRTGAYVFLNFDNSASGGPTNQTGGWQVSKALSAIGTEAAFVEMIAIDVEVGYRGTMSKGQRIARIEEAMKAIKKAGLTAVMYTSRSAWIDLTGGSRLFSETYKLPLWDVRYATQPKEQLANLIYHYQDTYPNLAKLVGMPTTPFTGYAGWNARRGLQFGDQASQTAKRLRKRADMGVIDVNVFADVWGTAIPSQNPALQTSVESNPVHDFTIVHPLPLISLQSDLVAAGESTFGKVIIGGPMPVGGLNVELSSDDPSAALVPSKVFVPAATRTASFTVEIPPGVASKTVTLTAITSTSSGTRSSTSASLNVGLALVKVSLPSAVVGGQKTSGSVILSGPAPSSGAIVKLSSSDPTLASPSVSSLVVPAGQSSASFDLDVFPVAQESVVRIIGSHKMIRTRTITLTPPPVAKQMSQAQKPQPEVWAHLGTGALFLMFPVALNASAAEDASRYNVKINDEEIPAESASYEGTTGIVRLELEGYQPKEWDEIAVNWDLLDVNGNSIRGESEPLSVGHPDLR